MAASFTQAITQFATLRTFARTSPRKHECAQLMRDLFPKARNDPHKKMSSNTLFELAWSFLSRPKISSNENKKWKIDGKFHRTGDLPALISAVISRWYVWNAIHRATRDPKTRQVLPAVVSKWLCNWHRHGLLHRIDRDARTGLTLPAHVAAQSFDWMRNGEPDRDEIDPESGLMLPTSIYYSHMMWYKNGKLCREDKKKNGLSPIVLLQGNVRDWRKFMMSSV